MTRTDSLDAAIRSVLADIAAAAPPVEVLSRPVADRHMRRPSWLLPVVAATILAVIAGLVVVATRDGAMRSAEEIPAPPPAEPGDYPTVTARVTSAGLGSDGTRVEIDRGTNDGVVVGMAVVDHAALVGKVTSVTDTNSVVLLVTDPAYTIECVAADAAADIIPGECTGVGTGAPMQFVSDDAARAPAGAATVTTQGGSISTAPPGIVIGALTGGGIEPAADLEQLSAVFVVRYVPASVPVDAGG